MRNKNFWILALTLVLILVMAFAAGCNNGDEINGNASEENNDQNDNNEENGEDLDDDADGENEAASGCWDYQPTTMAPNPGWDTVDFTGLTREELVDVLGCPPHIIRMTSVVGSENNRELWVYHPFEQDPTGLYVWLKGDVFHDYMLDEFNGFYCNQMMDIDFWD